MIHWRVTRVRLRMFQLCIVLTLFISMMGIFRALNTQITLIDDSIEDQGQLHVHVIRSGAAVKDCGETQTHEEARIEVGRAAADQLRSVTQQLIEIKRLLRGAAPIHNLQAALHRVNRIADDLRIGDLSSLIQTELQHPTPSVKTAPQKVDVCPDTFKGSTYGYPFFYTGWVRTNCTNAKSLESVVTIIMNFMYEDKSVDVVSILRNISVLYPAVEVHVAADLKLPKDLAGNRNFTVHGDLAGETNAEIWYKLLLKVKTPYVLVTRGITRFTWDAQLEQAIHSASSFPVDFVGSAFRTNNGHWNMGCQQSLLRNFTLSYKDGYDASIHECIYCDNLRGPFLARTNVLRQYKFPANYRHFVFEDVFLQVKELGKHQVVSCPDSMFFVKDYDALLRDKINFVPIASTWGINKLHLAEGIEHIFSCSEANTPCRKMKGVAVSPCCLQTLADAVKFLMRTCEEEHIYCELQEGTMLGAVKLGKVLPWERDADITFLSGNYSAFKELRPKFEREGYKFVDLGQQWCCVDNRTAGGKFQIGVEGWTIEMYGQHLMDSEMMVARGQQPTKVLFDGMWVNVPTNPGLFARNRYGHEIYKHAQHWMTLGYESGWAKYDTSGFSPCPQPGHHGCLDQYATDGNLQFEGRELL
ncbi:hypothetical protein Bbelb_268880 [Branchiostoma belcheri]|nr:hypothetical protein Bbelb_268880 [Branchiostoma belcheri]